MGVILHPCEFCQLVSGHADWCLLSGKHQLRPVTLPSGPPVRSDYERALERIRELEADITALRSQRSVLIDSERSLNIKLAMATKRVGDLESELYYLEEERLKACKNAGNTRLALEESMRNEAALRTRLSNLDILAREITERVTKMVGALDNVKPST